MDLGNLRKIMLSLKLVDKFIQYQLDVEDEVWYNSTSY
jgi:hypothetical protein